MQQTELAQRYQLTGSHVTYPSHVDGVVVVMVTTQFSDVIVAATVPHSRSSINADRLIMVTFLIKTITLGLHQYFPSHKTKSLILSSLKVLHYYFFLFNCATIVL